LLVATAVARAQVSSRDLLALRRQCSYWRPETVMMRATARSVTSERRGMSMITGFKNFLMRGDVVVIAVGLMVALAFSTLIKAFTDAIINPILNRFQGSGGIGLGIQLGDKGNAKTFLDIGTLISAAIYFIVFMLVLYFFIVVPYKSIMARRGETVFGEPGPVKTCPACLSDDLPRAASKCKYCGTDQLAGAS
jgi:large conductance mechanosensitive channel